MKNGTYEYKQSITNSKYKVVVCKGVIKLYELVSVNGTIETYDYRGIKSEKELEMYEYVGEIKVKSVWNLEYWCGGHKEVVMANVNYGLAGSRKSELARTTHKSGLLMIVRSEM